MDGLGLREDLQRKIAGNITDYQLRIMKPLIEETDVIIQSKAKGKGIRNAIIVPVLQRMDSALIKPQALFLVPTLQMADVIKDDCSGLDQKITPPYQLICNTPDRILTWMKQPGQKMDSIKMLVLYNADQMQDEKSIKEIKAVIRKLPGSTQLIQLCKTLPSTLIQDVTLKCMADPIMVLDLLNMFLISTKTQDEKFDNIAQLCARTQFNQAVMLCTTWTTVESLEKKMKKKFPNMTVSSLHGHKSKEEKKRVVSQFSRDSRKCVLITTHGCAEKVDAPRLSHIFNYDLPECKEVLLQLITLSSNITHEREGIDVFNCVNTTDAAEMRALNKMEVRYATEISQKELPHDLC